LHRYLPTEGRNWVQEMKIFGKVVALPPTSVSIGTLILVAAQTISGQDARTRLNEIPYSPTLRPTSGQTPTYFAYSFQKLKEAVPALKGLKYDGSQKQLTSILAGVAQTIADVLPRLPNLV
jgi:hypothetical protein